MSICALGTFPFSSSLLPFCQDISLVFRVIEVNRNPSLKCDTPLDTKIKLALLRDILSMADQRSFLPFDDRPIHVRCNFSPFFVLLFAFIFVFMIFLFFFSGL
jgi:hypothetical protein